MKRATLQSAARPLLGLTAAELMTAPVMTMAEEMSLSEAARLLCGAHISGAPVVDAEGRCVGVLSSGDFVTSQRRHRQRAGPPAPQLPGGDPTLRRPTPQPPDVAGG